MTRLTHPFPFPWAGGGLIDLVAAVWLDWRDREGKSANTVRDCRG